MRREAVPAFRGGFVLLVRERHGLAGVSGWSGGITGAARIGRGCAREVRLLG